MAPYRGGNGGSEEGPAFPKVTAVVAELAWRQHDRQAQEHAPSRDNPDKQEMGEEGAEVASGLEGTRQQ